MEYNMRKNKLIVAAVLIGISAFSAVKAISSKPNVQVDLILDQIIVEPKDLIAQTNEEATHLEEHCSKCSSGVFRYRSEDVKNQNGLSCTFCGHKK